jgi:hypothetical protein
MTKMQKKYCEEHEACNITSAPPSSWSWYEHFHSILGGTKKMNGAIGSIDQGVQLCQPQVVNLDDLSETILKTQ